MRVERNAGRRFDLEHGVTTQAILFLTDLDPEAVGDAGAHATHYEAVPVADFRMLMRHVPPETIERASFVDAGAGMGRAIILACEYPFARVRGVEISPGLCEVGRENISNATRTQRQCDDVAIERGDARIWKYPTGDLVVFMYNPFDGPAMEAALGAILHREDAGETWLMYHTPAERIIVENDPQWTVVSETPSGVLYRHD
ncbi:MAG: class I SAM-dependent methyltransferase [Candidatus Baltobacteraceae bacterium]